MGTCRALIVAGAALVGAVSAAGAADLPPPPPPPLEYAPAEPVSFSGWYIRGDVGVGASEATDLHSTFGDDTVNGFKVDHQSLSDSAFAGGGIGYQFNSWLRFDVTGEYRTEQSLKSVESYDCTGYVGGCLPAGGGFSSQSGDGRAYDSYTSTVQSTVALFNAYADIGTWYGFTPFIGGSVGFSVNRWSGLTDTALGGAPTYAYTNADGSIGYGGSAGFGGFGFAKSKTTTTLAWAATAGIAYAISPNLKLELAYRYLDMGDIKSAPIQCYGGCSGEVQRIHLASQDVKLGMRWYFSDIVAPPPVYAPPPPIIRKD